MSAAVAGLRSIRPTGSYTNTRDVTPLAACGGSSADSAASERAQSLGQASTDPREQIRELFHRLEGSINSGDSHAICFEIYATRDTIYQGSRQGCLDTMNRATHERATTVRIEVRDIRVTASHARATARITTLTPQRRTNDVPFQIIRERGGWRARADTR
jgi:hypothetical protein